MADARAIKDRGSAVLDDGAERIELGQNLEPDEFEAVFRRYAKPVLSFIYSLIANRPQAEELMQETFIRAFIGRNSRQETSRISTWLFGIAHNVVREAIRQKYGNQGFVALEEVESEYLHDHRQRPDQHVISREMFRKIQKALASLHEDHRIVIILKLVYRLQYEEIASITGASVAKLKTDLHRARLEMQRRLMPYFGEQISGMRGDL